MSNYAYTTDFGGKDALPTGDPDKVIQGVDFDTEFDKLVVAVNSKMDLAGGIFTGNVVGTTITLSGNLTALAVTGGTF